MSEPTELQARPSRGRRLWIRRLLFIVIAALYIVSVPWYRPTGAYPEIVFGLPDWVAVALGCYVGVAVLNALAWLLTDVPDREPSAEAEKP
jgi:hypothetical protein